MHYDAESMEEEVVEIAEGINVELDDQGELIGVEILNASQVLRPVVRSLESKLVQVA